MNSPIIGRIRIWTAIFIAGLLLSGITAIPAEFETNWLAQLTGADEMIQRPTDSKPRVKIAWLVAIRDALRDTGSKYPFFGYGYDWLAFGHFVIAIVFIGAWRDPVRNRWLFDFGLIACAMVLPYAFIAGSFRGIPIGWRLIDCLFGVVGTIPMLLCRKYVKIIEAKTPRLPTAA